MSYKGEKFLSIVIPVFNEEGNIKPLINGIEKACSSIPHEILLVNDGSTDGSLNEMRTCKTFYPSVKLVSLARNFGQTAALAAGFDHAKGTIIATLDGDGQNDPSDIPLLLSYLDEGYDIVSGWRKERKDPFFSRRLPSALANILISWVTGVRLHDFGCTLKVYRSSLIKNLQLFGEMHRFLPAWCVWQGGKIKEVPVRHHPRRKGKSKYGPLRIGKVLIDLLTFKLLSGYLFRPNYLFSGIGFLSLFGSAVFMAVAFYDKFGPDHFPELRIPLLLASVFFGLTGLLFILMGFLAEVSVRMYHQILHKKPYQISHE